MRLSEFDHFTQDGHGRWIIKAQWSGPFDCDPRFVARTVASEEIV
jgi:hypothetical protein